MINQDKKNEYLKAIELGFSYYGLNGFYQMHKDVCKNPDNPWSHDLECLNDLDYTEFELLCNVFSNR